MKAGKSAIQPKSSPSLNSCSIKISHCGTVAILVHYQSSYNTSHTQWNPVTNYYSLMALCTAGCIPQTGVFWLLCGSCCVFTRFFFRECLIHRLNLKRYVLKKSGRILFWNLFHPIVSELSQFFYWLKVNSEGVFRLLWICFCFREFFMANKTVR